jgi:5-methylcytosine-specific restriction enzyme A
MPVRLCTEPRCPQVATVRGLCPDHTRQRTADRNGRRRESRKVYNSKRWRILRRRVLYDHPICQHCDSVLATEVDHIKPIEQGGDAWALANLQALCARCHGRKTKAELS